MTTTKLTVVKDDKTRYSSASVKGRYGIYVELEGEKPMELNFSHKGSKFLYIMTALLSAGDGLTSAFICSEQGKEMARKVLVDLYPAEKINSDALFKSLLTEQKKEQLSKRLVVNHNFYQYLRNASAGIKECCKDHPEVVDLLVPTSYTYQGRTKTRKLKLDRECMIFPKEWTVNL